MQDMQRIGVRILRETNVFRENECDILSNLILS